MLASNNELKQFFTDEQIKIMSEAVYDHRTSLEYEPRTIYGKIVSSVDRNTIVGIPLMRTYQYDIVHNPGQPLEKTIERSRQHIVEKFDPKGYATEKMYFKDEEYKQFLKEISALADNKEAFTQKYIKVNNLQNSL